MNQESNTKLVIRNAFFSKGQESSEKPVTVIIPDLFAKAEEGEQIDVDVIDSYIYISISPDKQIVLTLHELESICHFAKLELGYPA